MEAARATIISEIMTTMKHHGISLDSRHVELVADQMTHSVLSLSLFALRSSLKFYPRSHTFIVHKYLYPIHSF